MTWLLKEIYFFYWNNSYHRRLRSSAHDRVLSDHSQQEEDCVEPAFYYFQMMDYVK